MTSRFTRLDMTPSCERILARLDSFDVANDTTETGHLVLALLAEESLGGKCLHDLGMSIGIIAKGCLGEGPARTATELLKEDDLNTNVLPRESPRASIGAAPQWCREILERAQAIARRQNREGAGGELSTEHLLLAVVDIGGTLQTVLQEHGVTMETVCAELDTGGGDTRELHTLAVDFELEVDEIASTASTPATSESKAEFREVESNARVLAVIDANLNRAREGLRVLEDYARFVQRDLTATSELKSLRHDLVATELAFRGSQTGTMTQRDTEADVGTQLSTAGEMRRPMLSDVVVANSRRIQEALRSLEEFGKIVDHDFAAAVKQLRYRSYAVEQNVVAATHTTPPIPLRSDRQATLQHAQLYVLITETLCAGNWKTVVEGALAGGADVIQLREKQLGDEELIRRGRWLASRCEEAGALFILNDCVDLAIACGAHGVHLGQSDESIEDARARLSPDQLVGISTHDIAQVRNACRNGADYLGTGPVFPSQTKSFDDFPGLNFVSEANAVADRPCFAIGGIAYDNLAQVLTAGADRVAVCSAVIGQADSAVAARKIKSRLAAATSIDVSGVSCHQG